MCASCAATTPVLATEEQITFNEHIRPILAENCFACHGSDAAHRKAKLRLDQAASATEDREGIRAIAPGDLARSELWVRINSTDPEEVMPTPDSHKLPLKPEQRAMIKRWIEQGAVYQKHWAYEPVSRPAVPGASAQAKDGQSNPIDRFVAAKLSRHGLAFASAAPRDVLFRRLTLDLTGLPPTPDELDRFLSDRTPDAHERAVDRLLASPRYGEHFARYWLDAVRYADSHGLHLDNVRSIWPYRDWVVRAFNANLPFDQFTIQQLAGDLLPKPSLDQLIASGYNRLNLTTAEGGAIEAEAEARNTADRTDTTAAVWLGLTANCASCHDHKFDPLTQREYYSLGAFFKGLADRVWDGSMSTPPPFVLQADQAQQKRLDALAAALPPLYEALSARAEKIGGPAPAKKAAATPDVANNEDPKGAKKPAAKPVTYEVIWAEDGDLPTVAHFGQALPAGEWRTGRGVPLAGGQRALRLKGKIMDRPVTFATGEVPLRVATEAKAFVYLNTDADQPPRAVGLEFISEEKTKRLIWGDPSAFDPALVKDAIVVGPLPPAGSYARLEIAATAVGLTAKKQYTGLRLSQSNGVAWWDHIGVTCTSPNETEDPLLNETAWVLSIHDDVRAMKPIPLTHEMLYAISLTPVLQNDAEKKRLADYHRDFIYGPTRGALEPKVHAVRRLLVEQIHHEFTLPASLISRELPEPRPAPILIRGQYDKPGELVTAATPAFLPPLTAAGARPTRLDLARWLVAPQNPLVARVAVNRFWQQLFGAGLVRTPGDFGVQGDPPTHPELLDWLASEWVRTGWDVKQLVRLMVTSQTYRQSSDVTPQLLELDPANKLLARGPRLRLDGEVLRDQALAVSGLLEPAIGGPPVRPYQPSNIWEAVAFSNSNTKAYVQDHGAALYRRSLYTFWKRTAPPPSMTTFDAPAREILCTGRGRSNTPLQALALMNDVQAFEAARAFAERLLALTSDDPQRLALAFRSVTAREPSAEERTLLAETLAMHRAHFTRDLTAAVKVLTNGESKPKSVAPASEVAAWTLVANLLLNLDETVTRN